MRFFIFLSLFSMATLAASPVEDAFLEMYTPILKSMGLDLKIEIYDESADYYGGASLEPGVFKISIGENQKSKPGILAFTLCHEMGHLLGGAPKKPTSTWASTEAQSDFYASSICMKEMYKKYPALVPVVKRPSSTATHICSSSYTSRFDQMICQSTADIALEFFTDVWSFVGIASMAKPTLEAQTPASVEKTRAYPSLQCRLEIGLSGAACSSESCVKPACF